MRILIVTSLSEQSTGGPAKYGPRLKEEFEKMGHTARLAQYASVEGALIKMWSKVPWSERVIALDTFSVGVPACLFAKLFGKKIIIRIGGDFLWESYVERTGEKITLSQFNADMPRLTLKENVIFYLTKILTKFADKLVFNTEWQKEIWRRTYDISNVKLRVVRNYIPQKNPSIVTNKTFLWAGRKIKLKNLQLLQELKVENPDLELKLVSNVSHSALQDKIKNCYAVILLSFSEVCPNFILEAISYGKPFIMTQETGMKEICNKGGIFVDPFDKNALKESMKDMLDGAKYKQYQKELGSLHSRPWRQVAEEFLSLCQ